eukprot:TRINITY_DN711_c0_g1_i4.p1 TRINITY_DN711_c0_g1~~TRINITY_DN711_c0_g1_i4.p1  ORF type:complete len:613 (-),score=122.87 TRINITY_DN711_c0_g1_i4:68-1906(-)
MATKVKSAAAERTEQLEKLYEKTKKHLENGKFCDPDFPATVKSLCGKHGGPLAKRSDVLWLRPSEFAPAPKLFIGGTESGDVIQGELGDCYFLGALSGVATREDLINDVVIAWKPELGVFVGRLYKNGKWEYIIVDDRIPCNAQRKPIFASCKDPNEQWVMLLEKVYAKVHGSYQGIVGGNILYAYMDLTSGGGQILKWGKDEDKYQHHVGTEDDVWDWVSTARHEQWLIGASASGAGVEGEIGKTGILAFHAYTLLDCCRLCPPGGKKVKLLRLRNPWGQTEWKGRWSDGSKEWSPEILQALNYKFADDGTFWMCLEDFMKVFTKLYLCRLYTDKIGEMWSQVVVEGKWKGDTAGGCMNHPTWPQNPQWGIIHHLDEVVPAFIVLSQKDARLHNPKKNIDAIPIGVYLFEVTEPNTAASPKTIKTRVYTPDAFQAERDFTMMIQLKPNVPYVLIPTAFDKTARKFFMTITTRRPCSVTKVVYNEGTCPGCHKPITGQVLTALDKKWHPECFVCSDCKKAFSKGKFFLRDDKPVCRDCSEKKSTPRKEKDHGTPPTGDVCGKCNKAITDSALIALDRKWHPACFVCTGCGKPFAGGKFFRRDNAPYCEHCSK